MGLGEIPQGWLGPAAAQGRAASRNCRGSEWVHASPCHEQTQSPAPGEGSGLCWAINTKPGAGDGSGSTSRGGGCVQAALFSAAPTQEGSVVLAVELSGFSIFSFSFFFQAVSGKCARKRGGIWEWRVNECLVVGLGRL